MARRMPRARGIAADAPQCSPKGATVVLERIARRKEQAKAEG